MPFVPSSGLVASLLLVCRFAFLAFRLHPFPQSSLPHTASLAPACFNMCLLTALSFVQPWPWLSQVVYVRSNTEIEGHSKQLPAWDLDRS